MKYLITIEAVIRKTIEVESDTLSNAVELAHDSFTVECEGSDEYYSQETIDVEELK